AGIDWAHAEALAFASLLTEGTPIRLTGQDTERGTFSQRHMVLHDAKTGQTVCPIQSLHQALAPLELHNSPLSELACLGFEYGYSQEAPETFVLWEAQFGDFVNSAQVVIDQFIVSGLAKWGQTSRLTLLLPHGYEGSGPGPPPPPPRASPPLRAAGAGDRARRAAVPVPRGPDPRADGPLPEPARGGVGAGGAAQRRRARPHVPAADADHARGNPLRLHRPARA